MNFESVFKLIVAGIISMIIASFSAMKEGVTSNKVEIQNIKSNVNKMGSQIDDIHWHFIRKNK